jgi:hypothetical protein
MEERLQLNETVGLVLPASLRRIDVGVQSKVHTAS